jgi:hypothetical protein
MRVTRQKPPAGIIEPSSRFATGWLHDTKHNGHARFQARYCDLEGHGFIAQNYAAGRGKLALSVGVRE